MSLRSPIRQETTDEPTSRRAQSSILAASKPRDRLLAEVSVTGSAGGTERRRPRWLALVAAAATVAGVLGVAVIVGVKANDIGPSDTVAPAASPQQVTSTTTAVKPVVEGLTPAQSDEIAWGCARSFGLPGPDGVPDPGRPIGPPGVPIPETGPNLAVYNMIDDEAGKLALIYGDGVSLLCTIDGPAMKYNPSGGSARPHELNGAFDVDNEAAAAGGDLSAKKPGYRGLPGYRVAAGRVSADVTRVTMAADGRTVEAILRNGTFIGRLVYPSTWDASAARHRIAVHAYGADGRELPADGTSSTWP
jgi:hypothetical protein